MGAGPRLGALLALGALAGFLVWLLVLRDDAEAPPAGGGPIATTQEELAALADELGHPIYWAGEQEGATLELDHKENGDVFLRYLTAGAQPGDQRQTYLTVGTYPFPRAYERLQELGQGKGALPSETPDGAYVVTNEDNPTSVYVAYPEQNLQIEVYDPDPERAFELATTGALIPVE
jgi:hypothetical protein